MYDKHRKYNSTHKLFSQWAIKTSSTLAIDSINARLPTPTHSEFRKRVASESNLEPTIRDLKGMTDSIALSIQTSGKIPEGTREGLHGDP
jgi:hypothetical protein